MSNHHLLVDEANKRFFDCEKYMLPIEARDEQPFDTFWLYANDGFDPPEESTRYSLNKSDAWALYTFMVSAGWKIRSVDLDDDFYDKIYPTSCVEPAPGWTRVGHFD